MDIISAIEQAIEWLAENHWIYTAFLVPIVFILYKFYKKNKVGISKSFFSLIDWIKPSFEENGKSSAEKLTAFTIVNIGFIPCSWIFMYRLMTFSTDIWHVVVGGLGCLSIHGLVVLMLYKIMKPAHLLLLKKGLTEKN